MSSIIDKSFKPTLQWNNNFKKLKKLSKKIAKLKYKYHENKIKLINCSFCWNNIEPVLKEILSNMDKFRNKKSTHINDMISYKIKNDMNFINKKNQYDEIIIKLKNQEEDLMKGLIANTCSFKHKIVQKKLKKWNFLINEYQKIVNKTNINLK
ncbi:hypothetical protein [Spiroplasma endosymbiont of Melieria omissa]|uniref:hypothetical protein n=1 Tax=Spiroplasma endosymbiont of Melieria omissa TaxID=3139324 RepID=UPI003CCA918B